MPNVIIYTSRLCGYCTMAKKLLASKGVSYSEIDVDSKPGLRQELIENTRRRTVPQIYIGDLHVGGFDDLRALDMQGELDGLLKTPPSPSA